jgi:NAD(P)-dependent dehydrogenase (short-subunit alcohol dehydrogenase family)
LSGEEFERVLKVNVLGSFLCARETLRRMKERGKGGRIINVGSLASHRSRPHAAAYTTSKFALRGLTESLALDARKYQVAVGMIHPGNVVSELLTAEERYERQQAEGFLEAEHVAQCVLTMVSLPYTANVLELTVLPNQQPYVGRG